MRRWTITTVLELPSDARDPHDIASVAMGALAEDLQGALVSTVTTYSPGWTLRIDSDHGWYTGDLDEHGCIQFSKHERDAKVFTLKHEAVKAARYAQRFVGMPIHIEPS